MRVKFVDQIIDGLIEREAGYVDHPDDPGGATRWGVTERVARANGYEGEMRAFPRSEAVKIYRKIYWQRPNFDKVAERYAALGTELFDTGVNMGPGVASTFLQRCLNALNRQQRDYLDLVPDGRIGPMTLAALDSYRRKRGDKGGEILRRGVDALQGARYIELAEMREPNESFLYGWLAHRVGDLT